MSDKHYLRQSQLKPKTNNMTPVLTMTSANHQKDILSQVEEISQIMYHGVPRRRFTIYYDPYKGLPMLLKHNKLFYITCDDVHLLTVRQLLCAIGYVDAQMFVDWTETGNLNYVLDIPVVSVQMNQINMYPRDYPVNKLKYGGLLHNFCAIQ